MEVLYQLIQADKLQIFNLKEYTYPFVEGPLELAKTSLKMQMK